MKLDRVPCEPGALVSFYEEGLTALGALCDRTWHDRLEIIAEGRAASLWNPDGTLQVREFQFAPADATAARDADREVFPGCPLTFRLAEALRPSPFPLERIVLAGEAHARSPDPAVAEKLWRAQFADNTRWRLAAPFAADLHFSLVSLVRCEIQSIDQHWSLRRLAMALPGGEPDESLAREFTFAQAVPSTIADVPWPVPDPAHWRAVLRIALEQDLLEDLASIRARQEHYLRRELDRIDDYFEDYENELTVRAARSTSDNAKLKTADRLAAAKTEHARRRVDQMARHEIRVYPHLDALLLVAEPAWRATLEVERQHVKRQTEWLLVPRARRWFPAAGSVTFPPDVRHE